MKQHLKNICVWLSPAGCAGLLLVAAGCADHARTQLRTGLSGPRGASSVAEVDMRSAARPDAAPAGATDGAATVAVADGERLETGVMLVESEPSGAQVVVAGAPVGKTPCRLILDASANGFCREAFSVKVRFIAGTDGGKSKTVEEFFTRLDKIPAKLRFTQQGATRVWEEK